MFLIKITFYVTRINNNTMAARCWKDVNDRLHNDDFVDVLLFGVNDIPKHIAFIYCGQKMIVVSANSGNKHAEENAMEKFRQLRDLSKNKPYRMYVLKFRGIHSMSRPCSDCSHLIEKCCPKARVYYTDYNGCLNEDYNLDNKHKSMRRTGRKPPIAPADLINNICYSCS